LTQQAAIFIVVALMDSSNKLDAKNFPRRHDTYLSSMPGPNHRCYFGGSNRCSCGKHRDPAGVSGIMADIAPNGTAREHLAVEGFSLR
jgi:hypothetical protein